MRARARLALLALVILCCGAMAPTQASAFISYYSCDNVASGTYCDGRANGSYDGENSWDYAEAWINTGGPLVEVCQRVYHPSSGTWLFGAGCNNNWAGNWYGNVTCVCYDAQIKQMSGTTKTIGGYADSAY